MKKQHYVPRFYLENWALPNTYQVYVYDIVNQKVRVSNITDVACENYFYDLDCFEKVEDRQFIENFFSKKIENDYSKLLTKIINRVNCMNQWEREKCYFVSEEDKASLSVFLALQFLRTKTVRNSIIEMSNCLQQILNDMGVPEETKMEYSVSKDESKYIHAEMIFDSEHIVEMATRFASLTWILIVNKTEQSFFTSDTPIGMQGHIKNDFMSMSGIQSEGIEIYFPLSPNMMLVMYDGNYHKHVQPYERRLVENDDIEIVRYYNSLCLARCNRTVFAMKNDFSIIDEILENNPDVFKRKRISAAYGGKTYTA